MAHDFIVLRMRSSTLIADSLCDNRRIIPSPWIHAHRESSLERPVQAAIRSSVVTKTMTERKDGLSAKAGGFIALPGGLGTLEELGEIASHRQLDLHMKPLVLLNTN